MRHGKKGYKLGRTASHRKATLAALSNALIEHKRITTTFTKAKALRMFVEPVINRAKDDTIHNRRQAFRRLRDKRAVSVLFDEVADAIGDRPGGYTRIVKLGQRAGDGAEMAVVELVDFNDVQPEGASSGKRRRRTRRGGGGGRRRRGGSQAAETTAAETTAAETTAAETTAAAVAAEEAAEETTQDVVDTADTTDAATGDDVLESPEVVDADEVEREAAEAAAEASEISAEESEATEDPRGREQAPRDEI